MRLKGTIIEWLDDRGFGFIEPLGGGDKVFCHIKAFAVRVRRPMAGDSVTNVTRKDSQGRAQATDVRPAGLEQAAYSSNIRRREPARSPHDPKEATAASNAAAYIFIATLAIVLAALVIRGRVSPLVPLIYVVMSGITIFAYAFDKNAAMNARWRTQEQTLHLLELLCGWPGALVAQRLFRHKSSKSSFQVEFWLCVCANMVGLAVYAG
jgi:uncharacterized membrane protein YsdA (DUF1294 family)/cold shock CspA family protein